MRNLERLERKINELEKDFNKEMKRIDNKVFVCYIIFLCLLLGICLITKYFSGNC